MADDEIHSLTTLKAKLRRYMENIDNTKTRVGLKYQATRYPVFKADKVSWGFSFERAEQRMLKAKQIWASNALSEDDITSFLHEASNSVKMVHL